MSRLIPILLAATGRELKLPWRKETKLGELDPGMDEHPVLADSSWSGRRRVAHVLELAGLSSEQISEVMDGDLSRKHSRALAQEIINMDSTPDRYGPRVFALSLLRDISDYHLNGDDVTRRALAYEDLYVFRGDRLVALFDGRARSEAVLPENQTLREGGLYKITGNRGLFRSTEKLRPVEKESLLGLEMPTRMREDVSAWTSVRDAPTMLADGVTAMVMQPTIDTLIGTPEFFGNVSLALARNFPGLRENRFLEQVNIASSKTGKREPLSDRRLWMSPEEKAQEDAALLIGGLTTLTPAALRGKGNRASRPVTSSSAELTISSEARGAALGEGAPAILPVALGERVSELVTRSFNRGDARRLSPTVLREIADVEVVAEYLRHVANGTEPLREFTGDALTLLGTSDPELYLSVAHPVVDRMLREWGSVPERITRGYASAITYAIATDLDGNGVEGSMPVMDVVLKHYERGNAPGLRALAKDLYNASLSLENSFGVDLSSINEQAPETSRGRYAEALYFSLLSEQIHSARDFQASLREYGLPTYADSINTDMETAARATEMLQASGIQCPALHGVDLDGLAAVFRSLKLDIPGAGAKTASPHDFGSLPQDRYGEISQYLRSHATNPREIQAALAMLAPE